MNSDADLPPAFGGPSFFVSAPKGAPCETRWHYRFTHKPLFAIFIGGSYLQWILPNTAPLHSLLYHCIVSTYLPYCIVSICHMMIMLHSGYLIKEQLINDFQPSGEEFVMPPHGNILMKCRRGALCNVVDCPTQLTLICILWYLYFMTNIKVTNMKKYSREICYVQCAMQCTIAAAFQMGRSHESVAK